MTGQVLVESSKVDDLEILVNPGDEVWRQLCVDYRKIGWGCFFDSYENWMKSIGGDGIHFIVARDKKTKELVGSVMFGRLEPIHGSIDLVCIGKYFVMEKHRGSGIGQIMWEIAAKHPSFEGKNFGLIGAQAMHKKYAAKKGFDKYYESDLVVQYRNLADCDISKLKVDESLQILDFEKVPFSKLIEFDASVTGNHRRDVFLKDWLSSESVKAAKVAVKDGKVVGYIGLLEMGDVLALNPLFAVDQLTASTLLKSALESIPNMNSYSKIKNVSFETNEFSTDLFNSLTPNQKTTTKLYGQFTKFVPKIQYDQVYSLTELGINVI